MPVESGTEVTHEPDAKDTLAIAVADSKGELAYTIGFVTR